MLPARNLPGTPLSTAHRGAPAEYPGRVAPAASSFRGEVARAYGVSQGWVSRLVARYRAEGEEAAFEPRPRRPKTLPNTISHGTTELIVRLRKELAG